MSQYEYKSETLSGNLHDVVNHMNNVYAKEGWRVAAADRAGYYTVVLMERPLPSVCEEQEGYWAYRVYDPYSDRTTFDHTLDKEKAFAEDAFAFKIFTIPPASTLKEHDAISTKLAEAENNISELQEALSSANSEIDSLVSALSGSST